jgi:hypothetical protein
MVMKRFIVAVLVFIVLPVAAAQAKTYPHKAAKVQVEFPDYWGVRADGQMVVASPRDGTLLLVLGVVKAKKIDHALRNLSQDLKQFVKSPKIEGKPESVNINGLAGYSVEAYGSIEGKRADLAILLLETPAKNVLLVLGIGEQGKFEKHLPAVAQILNSLKPM